MKLTVPSRSNFGRYGLAVLFVVVAAALRSALVPVIGTISPFLIFTLAQVGVALIAGRGPGLLAVLLGTGLGYFLFMEPGTRPGGRLAGADELNYLILNVLVAVALIWMADGMHRSRNQARRKAAEARAAHRRLSDLLARIGDAFLAFDFQWRCLYANQQASAMAAKDAAAMAGEPAASLLPGIFDPPTASALQRAIDNQEMVQLEGFSEAQNIWFELSAYPGPESVSVFIRDVTQKKRAATDLARSEEQFRRIFDESPVGMMIIDMDARILRANNAVCQMLEYSEEELFRMTTPDITPAEDRETSGFYSTRQQEFVTGKSEHLQMEKRYITKSGKILWTNLNASILREGRDHAYFLGIIENITDKKQVEEQLRESQKLESLGVLAGGIAHDFNNLLTGILGNASLSLDLTPESSPVRPLLSRLVQASERAADLTRQLLAYAGKGRFVIAPIRLSALVDEIGGLVRASFPPHVRLEMQLSPELPPIEADPAQIQQIVMNLLLNAAESIPEDRDGIVRVRTFEYTATEQDLRSTLPQSRALPGQFVALHVSDNGSGMDAATQSRIFEPFFTTKFTGRGLGLSAVLGIVSSYRGALRVESQPKIGTSFLVLLPPKEEIAEAGPAKLSPEFQSVGTVLVVDDEPFVQSVARGTLEREGYQVLQAGDGQQALTLLQQNPGRVQAVILDVTMPGMTCEETLDQLKQIRADLPVILSSGHSENETVQRFSASSLAGFLQKPYTASQLAEKIKTVLQLL